MISGGGVGEGGRGGGWDGGECKFPMLQTTIYP